MTTTAPPDTHAGLRDAAAEYAARVDVDVDLGAVTWEVSTRAKRRSGACLFDRKTESVTIRLTWAAYREYGWTEFRDVIRHELVHAWEFQQFGESGHGRRFREKAREVDAPRHCRTFTDARLRLVCTNGDCEWTARRHRASKAVTEPGDRRCGACRSRYAVEHVDSGERWQTSDGYEAARERIEEW
ncbi:SprT-like domain-containing protein [Halobacterium zhouii]|uniref:SprT-like domain-containing protein n=1 Tax=Halobacterium zhouii TaxID=2902624 RepID=UPI001E38BA88|nr:SprT-like domain-containing protein [Halobacterium zhouii]